MDGDHTIGRCAEVTEETLNMVYADLAEQGVALDGTLLKPNMVLSAKKCVKQAGVDEVAEATVRVMTRSVPEAVPGLVFLSGGQSSELASEHLSAMNRLGPHPWELSFSYGRALQEHALKAWSGDDANITAAQKAFYHRAHCNGAARDGSYTPEMETVTA